MNLIKNRKIISISILVVSILIIFLLIFMGGNEPLTHPTMGPFVDGVSVDGKGEENFVVDMLTNDSGMSGVAGKYHVHSNNERDMWKVIGNEDGEITVTFDFGSIIPLGEMWIWNYNGHQEEAKNWGLKDIQIYYSTDQENWQEYKGNGYPYRLAPGDGSKQLAATNLDDGENTPIQFKGTPAQYVKVVVENEPGKGNWSESAEDSSVYGLSEVRFYRYKEHVVAGGEVMPISIKTTGTVEELSGVENVINQYGLSGEESHSNDETTMWLASVAKGEEFSLIYDLGGTYPIESMKVWNYNQPTKEDAGLKNVRIFYSLDAVNWEALNQDRIPYEFAKGTGAEELAPTNVIDFNGIQAKYIQIIPEEEEGNWGRSEGDNLVYGLSEVMFVAASGMAVEPADEWTALFSNYQGWTGADGTYSLPLNEGTLFLFSDTYVGNVNSISKQRDQQGMVNNSLAILEGNHPNPDKIDFIFSSTTGDLSLFTPKSPGSWYWLQDGIVLDNQLYLFPIEMVNDPSGEAGFQFSIAGVNLVSVPVTEEGLNLEGQEQLDTPLFQKLETEEGNILFGAAILEDKDYVYVYGYKDFSTGKKDLVVARVKPNEIENFTRWEYWTGNSWSKELLESTILLEEISPELSVDYMEEGLFAGKYVAVFEKDSLSGYLAISTADTPYGPFTEPKLIYYVPEANNEDGIITYNAKAHSNLSKGDKLLISYNVNSTLPNGNMAGGDIYRPRWVKVRELLEKE